MKESLYKTGNVTRRLFGLLLTCVLSLTSGGKLAAQFDVPGMTFDSADSTLTITSSADWSQWNRSGKQQIVKELQTVIIEEGVTEIPKNAFYFYYDPRFTNLKTVKIPSSVKKIGEYAFSGCESLASVELSEGLETIEADAFAGYKKLTAIKIPASVKEIQKNAFYNCSELNSVTFAPNSSLTTIGEQAFESNGLTSIEIPATVTQIGSSAFYSCGSLESVTFAPNSSLTTIGEQAFASSGLTSIEIPATVTQIGSSTFSKCYELNSVTFNSTTALTLGEKVFSYCESLESVTFNSTTAPTLREDAFFECNSLPTINVPKGEINYSYSGGYWSNLEAEGKIVRHHKVILDTTQANGTYSVTCDNNAVSDSDSLQTGKTLDFTLTPVTGYKGEITINDVNVSGTSYTLKSADHDVAIKVTFTSGPTIDYYLKNVSLKDTITIVEQGKDLELTFIASAGYRLPKDSISVKKQRDGSTVAFTYNEGKLKVEGVTEKLKITAVGEPIIMYGITYDLSGVALTDRVETVEKDSALNVTLTAKDGYRKLIKDSIKVTGAESFSFDASTGKLSVPAVTQALTVKAVAAKMITSVIETDSIVNGDSLGDDSLDKIEVNPSNQTDTAKVVFNNVKTDSLVISSGIATLSLDAESQINNLVNEGTLILLSAENDIENLTIENKGTFMDESGKVREVTGDADLTIEAIADASTTEGSSVTLIAKASAEQTLTLTFTWQRMENGEWVNVPVSTPTPTLLSTLRAAEEQTNKLTISANEAGTYDYRCLVKNEVSTVSTTLVAYAKVTVSSSYTPSTTYYNVTLPTVEGATTSPANGLYTVEEWGSFSFTLTLDKEYDQSIPVVTVGDDTIQARESDGMYIISSITRDITISIKGIVKNTTTGNAEVSDNTVSVWGDGGVLRISSPRQCVAYVISYSGRVLRTIDVRPGEQAETLGSGIYIIRIGKEEFKIKI